MDRPTHEIVKVVWDSETLQVVERVIVPYDGPWHLCKGEAKQQMTIDNQRADAQLALQRQALNLQSAQMASIDPFIQAILKNGGLTPEGEAALRANTINNIPQQFNQLYGSLSNQLVQRGITGGGMAGSGDIARQFGALGAQQAGLAQQGEFNIASMKNQGLYQAMNAALGVGNQYGQNIGTFGSGAASAGSSATSAANEANKTPGFFGSLFGGLSSFIKP